VIGAWPRWRRSRLYAVLRIRSSDRAMRAIARTAARRDVGIRPKVVARNAVVCGRPVRPGGAAIEAIQRSRIHREVPHLQASRGSSSAGGQLRAPSVAAIGMGLPRMDRLFEIAWQEGRGLRRS